MQIAKMLGARVIGTVSTAKKSDAGTVPPVLRSTTQRMTSLLKLKNIPTGKGVRCCLRFGWKKYF